MNKCKPGDKCPYEEMIYEAHNSIKMIPEIRDDLKALRTNMWELRLKIAKWGSVAGALGTLAILVIKALLKV